MIYRKVIQLIVINIVLITAVSVFAGNRVFYDQLDRKVMVTDEPQRIVSLAPSITEIIFALGQEDRLKGVTIFSDYPDKAKQLPKVGSYIHLDLERIVALKPDLCIAIKDGNSQDIVDRLESLNIPVYAVDPKSLDSVIETIQSIGKLLGVKEKAQILVKHMTDRISAVDALIAGTHDRPRVFFQIGTAPIVSGGQGTFMNELIARAGGRNLAEGFSGYPRFSKEQVIGLSPEIFIITSMTRGEVFERVKKDWSKWSDMPAVKNNRIVLVDSNIFDRPTPRLVEALEELARIIHPEVFDSELKIE